MHCISQKWDPISWRLDEIISGHESYLLLNQSLLVVYWRVKTFIKISK